MAVVAAGREKFCKRRLRQHRATQRKGRFGVEDAWQVLSRGNPADTVAGRDRLRERRAVDGVATAIERDERFWPLRAETDVAVDVVLDQRHVVPRQQAE